MMASGKRQQEICRSSQKLTPSTDIQKAYFDTDVRRPAASKISPSSQVALRNSIDANCILAHAFLNNTFSL